MTECNQSSFGFETSGRREIVARFDGGTISSDGGAFLLRQADKRLNLIGRLAECFLDGRNQSLVEHSIPEMLSQRIYGLALGYEDLNDHEQLRTGRFFHGYYDNYCYLPLYVFCGDHVLCARLREANHDAAFGCLQEMRRIVKQIRAAWPEVKIVLRGDSGFCRNELMSWCENNGVDYLFGMARNQKLRRIIGQQMYEATLQWKQTGKPARVFSEFAYSTKKTKKSGWDRARRGGKGGTYRRERESAFRGDLADQ